MEQYNVILNKFPANPRSKRRLASQGFFGSESSSGGSNIGGSSFSGYWDLITTNAAGEALEEGKEYIQTKYSAVSEKDVVAYGVGAIEDISFPVASYNQLGLVGVTQGGGIIIDSNGYVRVDESILDGGGLDEAELRTFLSDNHYLTPTTSLYGYNPIPDNPLITSGDSVNSAFKKLELKVVDMVTISTDQTIVGQKTFEKTILAQKDVIAFATGEVDDATFPVASTTQIGIVGIKYGGGIVIDEDGYISISSSFEGGGSGIETIASSGTGNAVTSLTYDKSSKTLTYVKGSTFALASQIPTSLKSPYSLSWSGYSSGSYDGSAAKSLTIPSNTNQLTNGAGFIKDGNGYFTTLSGSGSSSKYLAGNGTFYTIAYSEISGTPNLSVYVQKAGDTMTGNLTIRKTTPTLALSGTREWALYESSGDLGIKNNGTLAAYFSGSNNGTLVLYKDLLAQGDVVAYSSSGTSDIAAIATSSTYGLVKYDNSTIKVNSSGQLYVASGGGGGGSVAWNDITGKPSWIGSSKPSYSWNEISSKPSWIGSSKPSYSWSEISSKPSGLVTSVSISGSGNAITNASFSGGTLSLTKGSISGGSSWNGGAITGNLTISKSSPGIALSGSGPYMWFGSYWQVTVPSNDFCWYYNNDLRAYLSYSSTGNMWIKGSLVQGSDMRRKNLIGDLEDVISKMMDLSVFRYSYKNDPNATVRIGMSAQQVIQYFPEFVFTEPDGYYSMDYASMSALAIKGIQEVCKRTMALENLIKSRQHWELTKDQQIKNLQDTVIRLQGEIDKLKDGRAA